MHDDDFVVDRESEVLRMEVSGVNRLLALAGEIGIGKTRIVGEAGRRESVPAAQEPVSQRPRESTGLEVTISSAARAKADAFSNQGADPADFVASPPLREFDSGAAVDISSQARARQHESAASAPPRTAGTEDRPAFAAYRQVDAATTSAQPQIRIRA